MKRIAVVVIAALTQPVYHHYIAKYWTELIRYTNVHTPHLDVYLVIENGTDLEPFAHVIDNVIEDPLDDFDLLVPKRFQRPMVPGILSKTVHAFDELAGDYDVFFRTNLSSMIKVGAFDDFVQSRETIGYAGGWVWTDALRSDLEHYDRIGPERSIANLDELSPYPGNTFISGSGFLLGAAEAAMLVRQRDDIRYDIIDDVSIGLMMPQHEHLPGLSVVVTKDMAIADMVDKVRGTDACHIRLERFPLEIAEALWDAQVHDPMWH